MDVWINFWNQLTFFLKDFSFYLILILFSFFIILFLPFKIYKSRLGTKKKKLLLSILFTFLIFVLTFSAIEAYFRYICADSDNLLFLKVSKKWREKNVQYITYNGYSFRDTKTFNHSKKLGGSIRIGVLGDSSTFGVGIKDVNNRFSNIIEKRLNDSGYNVEVYNLGLPGLDTQSEISVWENVKDLKFDFLVWQYYFNDIQQKNDGVRHTTLIENSKKAKIIEAIYNRSYFLDFLYWRLTAAYDSTWFPNRNADLNRYKDPGAVQKHQEEISNFIDELNHEGIKPIVVILPFFHLIGPNYTAYDIHQMMVNVFGENGVRPIDIIDFLDGKTPKDLVVSKFDAHPNEYVHKLIADKLYEEIVPILEKLRRAD